MRRFELIICLLLSSIGVFAQERIFMGRFKTNNSHFDVSVSRKQGTISLYLSTVHAIECPPAATELEEQVFIISGKKRINAFLASMTLVRNKYVEWTDIARRNNVFSLDKEIAVEFPEISLTWTSMAVRRYQNTGSQNPTYRDNHIRFRPKYYLHNNEWLETLFHYKQNVPYILFSGNAVSSNNSYISTDYDFSFSNVSEIDSFIDSIQLNKLEAVLNKEKARDDLFK